MAESSNRTVRAFIQISLDGCYCDAQGDMSFAHQPPADREWQEFVAGNASAGGALLFGRVTYELMANWWPTPMAAQAMPDVASRMNAMPKLVASRTLARADWTNTTIVADVVADIRRRKAEPGADITILGSGSIVTQLAEAELLDELQVVIVPIALGGGKPLLGGLRARLPLELTRSRTFGNGSVVLWYSPGRPGRLPPG